MNLVFDASAAVELLLRTEVGLRVLATVADAELFAPDRLDGEVTAVYLRYSSVRAASTTGSPSSSSEMLNWMGRQQTSQSSM